MGCYRIYPGNTGYTHMDAVNLCAADGGRLVLINSEAEARAFIAKLKGMYKLILNWFHIDIRDNSHASYLSVRIKHDVYI